jgi:hypothetical protein
MDHFAGTSKTWFRSVQQIEPQLLQTSDVTRDNKRWLETELPAAAPRGVDCYGKFGVYTYGTTDVLLHYYARNLDLRSHEAMHELGRAEYMDLDIVPHENRGEIELTVLWKGKPATERMVFIRGPRAFRKNIATDENGRVRFTPTAAGEYTFRTSVEEATPGQEDGRDYALVRHNCTMIIKLPLTE